MNPERFHELLGQLLDGELTPVAGDELVAIVRTCPDRRSELRQHLVLWELWAQQQATERSAEAFVAACFTRLRAEREDESFVAGLKGRMLCDLAGGGEARPTGWSSVWALWARFGNTSRALHRPAGWAWAGMSAIAVVAVITFGWFAISPTAKATTVHGEAVCIACTLHESHDHAPAIRVREGATTRIYYVQSDRRAILRLGDYCAAPVPLVATGHIETKHGRQLFDARTVEAAAATPVPAATERILSPF